MNLRDALIAGSAHGTDRLSVDADRRLRRRLGLESAASRRVWVWPALGAFAVAAAIAIVVFTRPSERTQVATPATDTLEVAATSPSATVSWLGATIVASPGTHVEKRGDGLVLAHGAIEIQRTDVKPMVVTVPMGRAVFASYRSSIKATPESVVITLGDGTGHFTDASGQTYPLGPAAALVLPAPSAAVPAAPPAVVPPSTQVKPPRGRVNLAPGETPPATESSGPPSLTPPIVRPDTPCTYKSDCAEGATCRKNEHGESVCMGHGGEGAACWFDNDCTSNLCVSRRCAP